MKKILKVIFSFLVLSIAFILPANAAYIVDTGEPPYFNQWAVMPTQWLAGQITLDQGYTITDIESYFRGDGGTLTMAIYGDLLDMGLHYPDVNNKYFSDQITVGNHPGSNQWYSLTGLNLNLSAGDYWVALEVGANDNYVGSVSVDVPNPLDFYVYSWDQGAIYQYPGGTFPLRVQGSPVPVPGALLLIFSGFTFLITFRKKILK